jgi:hypothetical protein
MIANFGQDSSFASNKTAQGNQDSNDIGDFYYTPPSGYLALCTKNLPDVAVTPSEHFNTVLYTGNATARSITGVGFQPDWVWAKDRGVSNSHRLFDSVRGVTKQIHSNLTDAETIDLTSLTSFNSDGFSLGSSNGVNYNTEPFVAWNWKANGSGSSNTDGTITSTVSANVDSGFSIVSYTGNGVDGATIGHGLSKAPEMVFVKSRTDAVGWFVYNHTIGNGKYLALNSNSASNTDADTWNNTSPSSSVITFGGQYQTVGDGKNLIAYCFHSVDGYSKVGSYTGNGSTDGTFVYTGFGVRWILIKNASSSGEWMLFDNVRSTFNPIDKELYANTSDTEATVDRGDLVSNGIKIRNTSASLNTSGNTYIYIAFAETPFKYSNAR